MLRSLLRWITPCPPAQAEGSIRDLPTGYPQYGAKDFECLLGVTARQARWINSDYRRLLTQSDIGIGPQIFRAGRDLAALAPLLASRYGMRPDNAGPVARFFTDVANARQEQQRCRELGITIAIWRTTTCGPQRRPELAAHANCDGQRFDTQTGLLIEGIYLLPGVAIGCTCRSYPLPGSTLHFRERPRSASGADNSA